MRVVTIVCFLTVLALIQVTAATSASADTVTYLDSLSRNYQRGIVAIPCKRLIGYHSQEYQGVCCSEALICNGSPAQNPTPKCSNTQYICTYATRLAKATDRLRTTLLVSLPRRKLAVQRFIEASQLRISKYEAYLVLLATQLTTQTAQCQQYGPTSIFCRRALSTQKQIEWINIKIPQIKALIDSTIASLPLIDQRIAILNAQLNRYTALNNGEAAFACARRDLICFGISPTPSPTPTPSMSPSPTVSSSPAPSVSNSPTPAPTISPTVSPTATASPEASGSVTPSTSPSASPTATKSASPSASATASATASTTPSRSPSISPSPTEVPTLQPTVSPSITVSPTPVPTGYEPACKPALNCSDWSSCDVDFQVIQCEDTAGCVSGSIVAGRTCDATQPPASCVPQYDCPLFQTCVADDTGTLYVPMVCHDTTGCDPEWRIFLGACPTP